MKPRSETHSKKKVSPKVDQAARSTAYVAAKTTSFAWRFTKASVRLYIKVMFGGIGARKTR